MYLRNWTVHKVTVSALAQYNIAINNNIYLPCSRLRKPKISRMMEAHHRSNPWTYLEVERSKVNFNLGRQMDHEDPYHRQVPRSLSESCWPISRERKATETPKLVGRLPTYKAHQFQGQRSKGKVTNADTENVSYLPNGKACELQSW